MITRIAVTGATGFIGNAVVKALAKAGLDAVELVRHPANTNQRRYDVDMPVEDISAAISGCDAVIHLAARVHHMNAGNNTDEMQTYRRANTAPVQRLAQAARTAGIKRLVFVSTAKVYGEHSKPGHPFETSTAVAPQGPYARSKHEAECALQDIAAGSRFTAAIIRPPLVYGPGVRANFAALARLARSSAALPFGGIHNKRSLVSLGNLSSLIVAALTTPTPTNCCLNASDGQDVSTTELLRLLATAQGKTPHLLAIPQTMIEKILTLLGRDAIAERLCGDFQLSMVDTCKTLNWQPPETREHAITAMFKVATP